MEIKTLEITEIKSDQEARTLSGYCSVKNNIDSYGDVIRDGAYKSLDEGLEKGFICPNHNHSNPIGYFTALKEDERGLYFEAKFHSTEDASEWMTIIQERKAAGKFVGLSIGYKTNSYEFGEVDGQRVRFLTDITVREATITMLPANEDAFVTSFKSRNEHYSFLVESINEYKTRLEGIFNLGRGDNFIVNAQKEVEELKSSLQNLENTVNSFVSSEADVPGTEADNEQKMSEALALAMAALEI